MALSNSYNWVLTRDQVITAALRKVNTIGTGETPSADLVSECATSLNVVLKALAADGMPLWAISEKQFTPVAGTATYTIGVAGTIAQVAPLKIHQAYRSVGTGTSRNDVPLEILSRFDYNLIPNKSSAGTPTTLCYTTPGSNAGSTANGTIALWPVPDSNFVTTNSGTITVAFQTTFDDMDAASDNLDFPEYWMQAVIWALADEISYDNGIPLAERSMIHKRAMEERMIALGFGTEEGSLRFRPDPNYLLSLRQ